MQTIEVIDSFGNKAKYRITKKFEVGYCVWNIGRQNFKAEGYIPLCKMDTDGIHIKMNSLKALYLGNDISDYILRQAKRNRFDFDEFCELSKIVPELKKYIK